MKGGSKKMKVMQLVGEEMMNKKKTLECVGMKLMRNVICHFLLKIFHKQKISYIDKTGFNMNSQ